MSIVHKAKTIAICVGLSGLTTLGVLTLWKLWRKLCFRSEDTLKILFFPDKEVACKNHFVDRHGCNLSRCRFSHNPKLSYAQLMGILSYARKSVELCVFCLTCKDLCDIIIDLHKKGVIVRIITDNEQSKSVGTQLGSLRAEGIQVRCDNTSFFMHHKFLIIDGTTLLNGSFNWTRQAITGNFENLCISNNKSMVQPYIKEFNRLWNLFDPSIS